MRTTMRNRLALLALLWLLVVVPMAAAAPFGGGLDDALGNVGETMENWIQNPGFRFGLVFILLFMVLYAAFAAGLNRVSAFKGEGEQPNKQGKTIAVSMGLMGAVGIAYWANFSAAEFTQRVLTFMGFFGAVGFAFVVFALTYYNMKKDSGETNWGMVLVATGLAMVAYGILMGADAQNLSSTAMYSLGMVLILAGLITMIIKSVGPQAAEDAKSLTSSGGGDESTERKGRPSPPHSFNAEFKPDGTVELSWTSPDDSVRHYELQRQVPNTGQRGINPRTWTAWRTQRSYTEPGSSSSSSDTPSLESGTQFRYRIRAVNENGRSDWAAATVSIESTTIRVKVEHSDGTYTVPINDLTLSLNGTTNHSFQEESGNPGTYVAEHVPQLASAYDLDIHDHHGVFQDKNFPQLFNPSSHDSNETMTIRSLVPDSGVRGTVACQIQTSAGHPFSQGHTLRVHGIGGFGMEPQGGGEQQVGQNGEVSVEVPAGQIVGLYVRDLAGEHDDYDSYSNGEYVFTRRPGTTRLPRGIRLQEGQRLTVGGKTYALGTSHSPSQNLPGIPVQFTNIQSGNSYPGSPTHSDSNGDYSINPVYKSTYSIYAPSTHYILYNPNGRFDNYPVAQNNQTINLPFLPGAPIPTNAAHNNGAVNVGFSGSNASTNSSTGQTQGGGN